MWKLVKKWNTLRNQILVVFLFVMLIVLLIVSVLTLSQVSSLLKKNAEKQVQQVAAEASGRVETLYDQINMASNLIITNAEVQRTLGKEYETNHIEFSERQRLMEVVSTIQANTDGIFSFELYSNGLDRVLPLDDSNLRTRVSSSWIRQAFYAKGKLVLIGQDPSNSDYLLAIRRVNLLDHHFSHGGYLLISIYKHYFDFVNTSITDQTNQFTILTDKMKNSIISNYDAPLEPIFKGNKSVVNIKNDEYIVTKQESKVTGWTVLILTPVNVLTEGIAVIRMGIIFSGLVGLVIYLISSFVLSNMITRPIIKLTNTMRRASQGSLTLNPSITSANEINELNSTYNQLVKETNHLIQMVYQKEITRSRSELKALQAQINPHFLFNTLDALHWSLEENEQEELAEHVVAMSNLFRYTINSHTNDDWVYMKDEMRHMEDYMEIMQMRFGERLNYHLSLPEKWRDVKIPKLIIQPLVENAVIHGAGNKLGKCMVTVRVEQSENKNRLRIFVEDDGTGMDEERLIYIRNSFETGGVSSASNGTGMAISNVYRRLDLYYKKKTEGLMINSKENEGTTISFEIPIDGGELDVQ
ncbi:sensor histidine kinase [Aquibacillus kalidii]|uniref:sensor histidine kinase n=1 Tax=Aquibacillus kalidii TaxID=2762597 RepID=UPI0016485334|nr:sensor histidine kinase [Aquibacillus kalidii]